MGMESSSQGNLQFLLFGKQIQLLYLIPQIISIPTLVTCVPYINFVVNTTPPLHFHTQFHRKCPLKLRYCLTGTLPCCACMLCAQDRPLKPILTQEDTTSRIFYTLTWKSASLYLDAFLMYNSQKL